MHSNEFQFPQPDTGLKMQDPITSSNTERVSPRRNGSLRKGQTGDKPELDTRLPVSPVDPVTQGMSEPQPPRKERTVLFVWPPTYKLRKKMARHTKLSKTMLVIQELFFPPQTQSFRKPPGNGKMLRSLIISKSASDGQVHH